MEYLVISEGLGYKIVQVLETYKNHIQVEDIITSLKKKIKTSQPIFAINYPDIKKFITETDTLQSSIDTNLLFELIDDTSKKYTINELATLYFGDTCNQIQLTALLFKLAQENINFNNNLDGSFNKCNEIEREKRTLLNNRAQIEQELFNKYYQAFVNLIKPEINDINILQFLHKPDKHTPLYRALISATQELGLTPLELCHRIGLVPKIEDFFVYSFMEDNFPKGIKYSPFKTDFPLNLPFNQGLNVFSIDDVTTTEVDDAFSVQYLKEGYIIGIHIAAPAIDQNLIEMAANNFSTVYYPGHKITMFPLEIINYYSLNEGANKPVVSIYFTLDNELSTISHTTKLEIVAIKKNLRIENLEQTFTNDNLEGEHNYEYGKELKILYAIANKLEEKRGKPSTNNLITDYSFSFESNKVILKERLRGNPIDKLVSELMILANCTWGRMLTNAFIPAIYRVKQPNYPVKMTLSPDSHTGLNVDYYTWATSPLRRAVDYLNQWQIICLLTEPKKQLSTTNPNLLNVIENFDSIYSKYFNFQNKMERYWSLRYLLQEQISEITGVFIYKTRVQLSGVPLEINVDGIINAKPKGSEIKLKIFNINPINLTFDFKAI